MGMAKHETLRNVATDGEAEHIDLWQSQGIDEYSEVIAHRVDGVRRFAARTGDTCIVEEDYGTSLRKPVRHNRIPVVEAAAEVLKEDERRSAFRPEAPVCVVDPISLKETGWSRDVSVLRHIDLRGNHSGRYVRIGIKTLDSRASPIGGPIVGSSVFHQRKLRCADQPNRARTQHHVDRNHVGRVQQFLLRHQSSPGRRGYV
jgi:hypothetical protein